MGREWVEFFLRESQFFRGKDWVLFVANIAGVTIENLLRRGGGGEGGCHQNSAESSDPPPDVK